jgi:hypothetical protein
VSSPLDQSVNGRATVRLGEAMRVNCAPEQGLTLAPPCTLEDCYQQKLRTPSGVYQLGRSNRLAETAVSLRDMLVTAPDRNSHPRPEGHPLRHPPGHPLGRSPGHLPVHPPGDLPGLPARHPPGLAPGHGPGLLPVHPPGHPPAHLRGHPDGHHPGVPLGDPPRHPPGDPLGVSR